VFGQHIIDASVSQDLLVVSHRNGTFNFYNLTWILEQFSVVPNVTIGQLVELPQVDSEGTPVRGVVGDNGFGIPVTIEITGKKIKIYSVNLLHF